MLRQSYNSNNNDGLVREQLERNDVGLAAYAGDAAAVANEMALDALRANDDDGSYNHDDDGDDNIMNEDDEDEDTLPDPSELPFDDPRRMKLTRDEREWAMDIKEAIENTPEIDPLCDLMIAQLAVITRGDTEDAVRRALGLQAFFEEYKILDTPEEGHFCLRRLVELLPAHLLAFSFSQAEGTYVIVHDVTKIDTRVLNTSEKVRNWMASSYYLHTAMSPDLASIRRGNIAMAECSGMDFTKKQDFKLMHAMFSQLLTVYPFISEFRGFHTGTVFNVFFSMVRQILPKVVREKMRYGLKFDGRLDEFYLVPDMPTANERLISRLTEALQLRYDMEKTYSL